MVKKFRYKEYMNMQIYAHINKQWKSITKFNKKRFYDILDIFKNSLVTFYVTLFITKFITKLFLIMTKMNIGEFEKYVEKSPISTVIVHLALEFSVFAVIFYYLEKFVKLIPPLPMFFDSGYKSRKKTVNIALHLIMIVLLVEFSPTIKIKLERVYKHLSGQI